ncbi:MAG: M48 family metalloprotease [Pseudomonadota bacterium]
MAAVFSFVFRVFPILPLLMSASFFPGSLQAQSLIRDADIEHGLRQLARPLVTAAGLSPNRMQILLVNDDRMNAFVVDTKHVFIHSGMVLRLDSAPQLQSVIAHELAHIANGHLSRRVSNMKAARSGAGIGLLVALAAAAAGAGEAAAGLAIGSQGAALQSFLAHTRAEEASADQSSVNYLTSAGIDPRAASEVLERFVGQDALSVSRQDPYVRSHPLSRDRMRALSNAAASKPRFEPDADHQYWFDRARGKLGAFIRPPAYTLRQVGNQTGHVADMQRAVAHFRDRNIDDAIRYIDRALSERPEDPFLMELKGQILFDSRRYGPAIETYAEAVALAPRHPLILAGYGRALLATDTQANNTKALEILQQARARDRLNARLLRDLAMAYARAGDNAMASLSTAERYALQGRLGDARVHAARAAGALPRGSTPWNRAQDILTAAERVSRR